MNKIVIWVIKIYKCTFAFFFGGQCRFYPSCSVYAEEATRKNGTVKGIIQSVKRILKCHPFHAGGYDPVV